MKSGQNPDNSYTDERIFVILHDIRSAHNVGSIFRTADAALVAKIYLTGVTPTPVDRFGRKRSDLAKVALGAEELVPWEFAEDTLTLIERLKEQGVQVLGVEQTSGAVSYRECRPQYPLAFVFGNEVDGIPEDVVRACDASMAIPMLGKKESLNVAVTAGIILFHFGT